MVSRVHIAERPSVKGTQMTALRVITLLAFSALLVSPLARACDLQSSTNQSEAARYVESVRQCLSALPRDYTYDRRVEQDNIRRVNAARIRRGLAPLKERRDLLAPARWHSLDMAANAYFNHRGKDNRTHGLRISLLDRTLIYDVARENIAMMRGDFKRGSESELLHDLLMDSEGHYENIMADDISHIAVGVVRTNDGVWLTQLFVNEAGELSAPAPVRLTPGQILGFDARLSSLSFSSFQAEQGQKMKRFQTVSSTGRSVVPRDLSGDIRLGVRGDQRPTSTHERGYYVNLFGPSVTLVSPVPGAAITKVSPARASKDAS